MSIDPGKRERGDTRTLERRRREASRATSRRVRGRSPRSSSWSRSACCSRMWRLGFNGLSYDESFTTMAARMPIDRLFDYLRTQDTHPPFDYLLRAPFAPRARRPSCCGCRRSCSRSGAGAFRVVDAGTGHRRRRRDSRARRRARSRSSTAARPGCTRCSSCSVSPRRCSPNGGSATRPRWSAWAAGGLVVLALFDHVSGFLLAAGMLAVAGLRTDRRAWEWRAGVVGAVGLWAVVWGTSFAHQAGGDWVGWIPRTSPTHLRPGGVGSGHQRRTARLARARRGRRRRVVPRTRRPPARRTCGSPWARCRSSPRRPSGWCHRS